MGQRSILLHADIANPADCAPTSPAVHQAAAILRSGGTVAFATETVYGLGANALDPKAIAKIFAAKQRPSWDPLIVHIADTTMLPLVASTITPAAQTLLEHFWPGPLTLLLPRAPGISDAVTSGRPLVGVRIPAHPVAQALIRAAGLPIAAPSANTFGHVSPTTAAHVAADLDGRIDAILDSGPTLHGVESTVVDASQDTCILYRPGAITLDQLRAVWPATEPYSGPARMSTEQAPESLPSPGVGIRHYAPRARLVLVSELNPELLARAVATALDGARSAGVTVGLMLPTGLALPADQADFTYPWGAWNNSVELAQRLFAGLRHLDERGADIIVCPVPPPIGVGVAIHDRLHKTARSD